MSINRAFAVAAFTFLLVASPSHGQGEVKVGTNIPPMTRGPGITRNPAPITRAPSEEPALATAIARLNEKAKMQRDETQIWKAISAHTKVPVKTLRDQRIKTKLNHGELLVANTIAAGSKQSLTKVLALHATAGSWTQVAKELRIEPALLINRLTAADASLGSGKTPTS